MPPRSSAEIRWSYLKFFADNGHQIVPSSSLIPGNDPTLLFANSGMVQFKDTFTGLEPRSYNRATTAQKCMRVSGKHNDLEDVGLSPRHQTFFEMMGNFSFGDYFKEGAITFAWKYLTEVLELPVERLWFTVFEGNDSVAADDEAAQLWVKAGASPDRVLRFGMKDNFWEMGDVGPCGPSSEITYYLGDLATQHAGGVNSDDNDYLEIWNLVFMQYMRDSEGKLTPLPKPSVDTGMGFERMVTVMQNVTSNYQTDLFVPLIKRTIELAGTDETHYQSNTFPYHVIADHVRACSFLIADGVLPGNEGRSYVLRRILRRAAYQARTIGLTRPFMAQVAETLIEQMGEAYPELRKRATVIAELLTDEEKRFGNTLSSGLSKLDTLLERLQERGETVIPGEEAFRLKDTDGFPLDLTQKIVAERGFSVDTEGYERALATQRQRSRASTQFKNDDENAIWADLEVAETKFHGYDTLNDNAKVLALVVAGDERHSASQGERVQIALDRTPFYAESGGQVGDAGMLIAGDGVVRIDETRRPVPGIIVHYGSVVQGEITVGSKVEARVDSERRADTMSNHTATHLLHKALHEILGEHATQAGSLVEPDRLRFDFAHNKRIEPSQLREIERHVNNAIRASMPVGTQTMAYTAAIEKGAMALFGEKYTDRVRVVSIGDDAKAFSRELCGGTHVSNTGTIGTFRITSESSVASGVRRIEAVTGTQAELLVEHQESMLRAMASKLGVPVSQIGERVNRLLEELKQTQREVETLRSQVVREQLEGLLRDVQRVGEVFYITAQLEVPDIQRLREAADWLRDKMRSGIVVLGCVIDNKPNLLVALTPDVVQKGFHAGQIVKELAQIIGGSGGGRPDIAQAGGRDPEQIDTALSKVSELLGQKV